MINSKKIGGMQVQLSKLISKDISPKIPLKQYSKIVDNSNFEIYRCPAGKPLVSAAYLFSIVMIKKMFGKVFLDYIPDIRVKSIHYIIPFNSKRFPGLISDSKIVSCYLIPYIRAIDKDVIDKRVRLLVITDKCQAYHNCPSKGNEFEGTELLGDISSFEESAIWDIPGRKYPTKCEEYDSQIEYYAPYLPDEAYEYHPSINKGKNNIGFDKYTYVKNGGKDTIVSRFYFPIRKMESNSFYTMGGFETDYKMTLIGTYRSNKSCGVRTVVFATSDGGRNIYAKYEFSDEGEYDFKQGDDSWGRNFGNPIDGEKIRQLCGSDYDEGSILFYKRGLCHDDDKKFSFAKPISVKTVIFSNPLKIITEEKHGLETGNIICFQCKNGQKNPLALLCNNMASEESGGNGLFFKVSIDGENSLSIYECVSNPYNNIACRHIHHINRIRDGWIMGTGEIYPNGWLFYIQMKESDTYSKFSASDELDFIQLTQNKNAVQRTVGADLIDGDTPMMVIASDHDLLPRNEISVEYRNFSRNSIGIYKGKLSEINDFSKYSILFETHEPAFFFKKLNNSYVFCGQRGEIAIEKNGNWYSSRIDDTFYHYNGFFENYFVMDKYIIKIK